MMAWLLLRAAGGATQPGSRGAAGWLEGESHSGTPGGRGACSWYLEGCGASWLVGSGLVKRHKQ